MKTILLSISAIVFLSYVIFIYMKYGVLKSISDSYYKLPKKYNFIFTFFCWGFALPIMFVNTDSLLLLIACGAILFVGAAAGFREPIAGNTHIVAAYASVILSQAAIYFDYGIISIPIIFVLSYILLMVIKESVQEIWWIEIIAFAMILIVLIFK